MTIKEASEKLGLTTRAIRYRLAKGTMRGKKVSGVWFVYKNNKGLSSK